MSTSGETALGGPIQHILAIDCIDCGKRTLAYQGRCGKCGGNSWLPAGYSSRKALKRLYTEWLETGSDNLESLNKSIAELLE